MKIKSWKWKIEIKIFFCFWFNIDLDSEFPVLHFGLSKKINLNWKKKFLKNHFCFGFNKLKKIAFDSTLI